MKEYRGCKYKTLDEIRQDMVNNIVEDCFGEYHVIDKDAVMPQIQVLIAPFRDSGYIPLSTNYTLEMIMEKHDTEEALDIVCKEAIDKYFAAYEYYKKNSEV